MNRRTFVQQASAGLALPLGLAAWPTADAAPQNNVGVKQVSTTFEREPLATPYGFKGGYMTDVWQTVVRLQSTSGRHSIGLGTQNVLWSDARVFTNHSESGGNALMYAITERAAQLMKGQTFASPIEMQEQMLERTGDVRKAGDQQSATAHHLCAQRVSGGQQCRLATARR